MPKLRPFLPTMTIRISEREWRCGDGCCSDSWYEIELINDQSGNSVTTEEHVRDREACILRLLEEAKTEYGVEAAQVNIEGDPWEEFNQEAVIVYLDENGKPCA